MISYYHNRLLLIFVSLILLENGIQLEITPHEAGHTLGGTVWRIKTETDDIVYAVDYNHKKER